MPFYSVRLGRLVWCVSEVGGNLLISEQLTAVVEVALDFGHPFCAVATLFACEVCASTRGGGVHGLSARQRCVVMRGTKPRLSVEGKWHIAAHRSTPSGGGHLLVSEQLPAVVELALDLGHPLCR